MQKYYTLFFLFFMSFFQKVCAQQENRAFVKTASKWSSNSVRVSWINPSNDNVKQRKWVEEAIKNTWEKESGLNFIWCRNDDNKYGIRILIADDWPHTTGLGNTMARSEVGMVLNFDFYNWIPIQNGTHAQAMNRYEYYIRVIAIHEFGHAIGFAHEQNRKDCPVCDKGPQGDNGDWWTPTCDKYSVMNYCNPVYSNNGILSNGDIEGVRALYGPPVDIRPSSNALTARLVHSVNKNEDNSSTVKVYLTGDNSELNNVNKVTYKLDNRFNQRIITSDNANSNFSLQINLKNSMDFTLNAVVEYNDGTTNSIQRYINFNPGTVGQVNANEIKIDFEKTDLKNDRYLFGFSINPNSVIFNKIVRVEYTRDHSTFSIKTLTADNAYNNFKVEWNGWGCLPIQIKVFYLENNQMYFKSLSYDMCSALGWY